MELTGTNRPKAYFFEKLLFAFTVWFLDNNPGLPSEAEAFYSEILNNEVIR